MQITERSSPLLCIVYLYQISHIDRKISLMTLFRVPGPIGVNVSNNSAPGPEFSASLGNFQAPTTGWTGDIFPSSFSQTPSVMRKMTKTTDLVEQIENDYADICHNVRSEAFGKLMMDYRDEAVAYIKTRTAELHRWDEQAKARTLTWFNSSDDEIRDYLLPRLGSTMRVLKSLTPDNFDYDTGENRQLSGCLPGQGMFEEGAIASVCPIDTERHRILINMKFFTIPKRGVTFGTNIFTGKDSQLQTLIHEVTHFNDVASSTDDFYSNKSALFHAKHPKARMNADSLAGYILGINI
ncbi:M35 family metallo-endopeptidase [Comamonas sp. MYb396]|uniref:M35 family metallo-endopeptidase n=1 Tax=Comamonas sp. MYb396 TaxID=2745302 RepID=UPI0030951AAD